MISAGLSLVSAFAWGQEDSGDPGAALDSLLVGEGYRPGELGPTGRRLYADELLTATGVRGRFGFGFRPIEWRAPLALSVFDEEGDEIDLAHVRGAHYPSHSEETWAGGGLELTERKYITFDDTIIVDFDLRESTGERDRELLLQLSGDATPWRERVRSTFEVVSFSEVDERFHREAGSIAFASGRLEHDGVVFFLVGADAAAPVRGVGPSPAGESARLPLPDPRPAIGQLHVLLAAGAGEPPPISFPFEDGGVEVVPWPDADPPRSAGDRWSWRRVRIPGTEATLWHLAYDPPPGGFPEAIEVGGSAERGPLLLAATLEVPPRDGRMPVLLGEIPTASGVAHLCLAGTGFASAVDAGGDRSLRRYVSFAPGDEVSFRGALATGSRILPVLARAVDATVGEGRFAAHLAEYRRWFAEQVPGFSCSDRELEFAWAYDWYQLRRQLLVLDELNYTLPIFRDVSAFCVELRSLPEVLAQARWLTDLTYAQGQVRAFMIRQRENGDLPVQLPFPREWGTEWRLPAAIVDAFAVNGSELFLRENLPLLEVAAKARASGVWAGDDPRSEVFAALMEFPALARGRRALGEEGKALALEERFREAVEGERPFLEEYAAELARGTTFVEPDAQAVPKRIADTLARYSAWRGEGTSGSRGSQELIDRRFVTRNDYLIRYVGGLRPRDDGRIELRPRYPKLEHFAFEQLHYRGRVLDLYWDHPDGTRVRESIPEGYSLFVDGETVFHAETLADVVLD